MTKADIQIELSSNAEFAISRNKLCPMQPQRIAQIVDRYGMILRTHWNEELEVIARNPWVSYCIYEWCDGGPLPSFSLSGLLGHVAFELEEAGEGPDIDELNQLIEVTSRLSPFDQLAIMEFVEHNH